MNTATLNLIHDKLKAIPDNMAGDVLAFLDFLKFKITGDDWYHQLSDKDITLIQKGEQDIANGRTFTHEEAMSRIKQHIQQKHP